MKKCILVILMILTINSCKDEDNPLDVLDSTITAKQNASAVVQEAKESYSSDAKLTAVYGWNVDQNGEIDLLDPSSNAFVYIMQSSSKSSNEFYVPVYAAGPVKSPINFSTIIGAVKDTTAASVLGKAFAQLSKISISENAQWVDSPEVLRSANSHGGSAFSSSNPNTRVDMILLPSMQLVDSSYAASTAWIVNYIGASNSLVLLIDGSNANFITKISD